MGGQLLAAGYGPFDALDDDEHLGVAGEDSSSRALGGAAPVGGEAGAPCRGAVGLVLEIEGHDVVGGCVPRGKHLPGGDPVGLGEAGLAVPESVHESVICLRVVVEDDHESQAAGFGDDGIHDLQRCLALEVGVAAAAVIDARGGRAAHGLQGEGNADRVEAQVIDLLEHVLVVARPQPVRRLVGGLETEPVDALPDDRLALRVGDAVARGHERVVDRAGDRRRRGRGRRSWRRSWRRCRRGSRCHRAG